MMVTVAVAIWHGDLKLYREEVLHQKAEDHLVSCMEDQQPEERLPLVLRQP